MEIRNQLQCISNDLRRDVVKLAGAREILARIESGVNDLALSFVVGQLEPLLNDVVSRHEALEALMQDATSGPGLSARQAEYMETLRTADDMFVEHRAAELLDQALQARHDSLTASDEHEDYDHPDVVAAFEREDEASEKLLALDAMSPAVAAAQLAYLVACGESGECVFENRRGGAGWLDFAAVDGYTDRLPVQQGAAKVVATYLRTHEGSSIAAVIARHRALGSCSRAARTAEAIAAE
jgi:hypothetical protein